MCGAVTSAICDPYQARQRHDVAGRRSCTSPGGGDGRPPDVHRVGPGELHLGILMETMRREGSSSR